MPKKKQPQQQSSSPSPSPTTPNKTRGPNSTTVVVSMKTAMRDALMLSAEFNLKSLSGQAAQYILEGLKRDGFLPAQVSIKPPAPTGEAAAPALTPPAPPPAPQTPF